VPNPNIAFATFSSLYYLSGAEWHEGLERLERANRGGSLEAREVEGGPLGTQPRAPKPGLMLYFFTLHSFWPHGVRSEASASVSAPLTDVVSSFSFTLQEMRDVCGGR
jgi:hypothetical protein